MVHIGDAYASQRIAVLDEGAEPIETEGPFLPPGKRRASEKQPTRTADGRKDMAGYLCADNVFHLHSLKCITRLVRVPSCQSQP